MSASRRHCVLVLCVAIGLATTMAYASPASAIGIRNSKCEPGNPSFAIISNGSEWVQTFPATRSGKLLTVELKAIARASGGSGGDINVNLFGTDGTGTPVEPVLASTSIPTATVTSDGAFHEYSANFNPATAHYLTTGKTYGIGIETADTAQNSWGFNEGDPCEGVLFGHYGGFTANAGDDAGLVTYVGPANDDFADAQELVGREVAEEGTTAGATRQEPGEPDHYETNPPDSDLWKGDHSVWFRWKAPNSGPTTIDTCIGDIDSILAVYTGDELESLTRVGDNNNDPACAEDNVYGSKVSFEAVGGTIYDIAVGDAGGAREGPFAIRINGAPDTTPPETQIDSGPSGPTTDASPSFAFSSSEPGSSFECRLDSSQESAFAPCTSPKAYPSLPLGAHSFEVRAIDEAENVDPTPATRSFTIESAPPPGPAAASATAPDTRINRAKVSQAKSRATFRFGSTEPGSTFVCRIDRRTARPCHSPKSYRHLKAGKHTFSVFAVDAAGQADPTPALRKFKITP